MMNKEEKRRKYHNALLNLFYPPQPPPPLQQQPIQHQLTYEPVDSLHEGLYVDWVPADDDNLEKGNSLDDISGCAPQKLTRAQRKRIRRKKLKEDASRRRKIIGPLLPTDGDLEGEPSNCQNKPVHNTVKAANICVKSPEVLEHTHSETD